MKTRQDIKADEEEIRTLIQESNEENAARRAWRRTLDYFMANDVLEGNSHSTLIKYIYLTRHYSEETCYCMAWKNSIGERTLYRYRKKYIICFKFYYTKETSQSENP